jgi:Dolichyl-phosphate-mannose-protein mannosyltransferase
MRRSLEEIAALAGLGFLALSPAAITASTEVRQYGLLLFFVCGSLYATQRVFAERSTTWAIVQGLFLVGALLTHYTTIIVLASLGLYVSLRLVSPGWVKGGVPRGIPIAIGASQLVLATLLGFLYFGHIRRSVVFRSIGSLDYLRRYYYAEGRESPLGFVWRAVSGTFSYAVGPRPLAILLMLVFVAGLAALLAGRTKAPGITGLLVISPFVMGFVAAVLHVFPFAGSRHQTYLLPFLAVGISAALAWLPRGQAVPLLLLGVVIAPVWVAHSAPENDPRALPRVAMTETIDYLGRTVPRGEPLFVDDVTLDDLRYYLARNETRLDTWNSNAGVEERLDGYLVVVPRMHSQIAFLPAEMVEEVTDSARALGLPPGDPLWVVSAAWKEPSLGSRLPVGADREVKEFGRISVIRIAQKRRSLM